MSKYYTDKELDIKLQDTSMYDFLEKKVKNFIDEYALDYFNKKVTFKNLLLYVEKCSKALKAKGIKENDVITICMPNTPEAVILMLAANKIGAVFDLIHPLSSEVEIKNYVNESNSKMLFIINVCYEKVKNIKNELNVNDIVIINASDSMPLLLNIGYNLKEGKKVKKSDKFYIFWKDFLQFANDYKKDTYIEKKGADLACILHSGGTTGKPKSIMLSNYDFIAISTQGIITFDRLEVGDNILCILPLFHCFGLMVCVYAPLTFGMTCILVPQFDAKRFDKLLLKYQPTVIAGVPTLFEAMLKNEHMDMVDLSCLKYVISGGDTLNPTKNEIINKFLKDHFADVTIAQGYGMTETSGPVTFGAKGSDKLGSCGSPLPGNEIIIVDPKTKKILPPNKEGEIYCFSHALMIGYINSDGKDFEIINGKKFIKTGDLGYIDDDGVLFYSGRLKRIIISSGYNIYPTHIEDVIKKSKYVKDCCVIGKDHPYKKQIPIIYIVLEDDYKNSYTAKKNIMDYAKKNLSYYMIPKEYYFRDELPKTMIGKIDYHKLENEFKKDVNN